MNFENFGLSQPLLTNIHKLGITEPTEVQEKSIPAIMEGRDVIGESATGSGKTLAFGCGIIDHVVSKKGIQAIVLTPTRELAEQVKSALADFSKHKSLLITAIYGGVAINPQIHQLTKAEVVVATPGRFLDHLQRGTMDTSKVKLLVLDEADRMVDMGFIDDVRKIIQACPTKRQTLFFSATISGRIRDLSNRFMHDPVQISATKMVDPSKLKQIYYDVERNIKLSLLIHLLQHERGELVMVFCNTRRTTDFVVNNLKANKVNAIAIHGGFAQNKRLKSLDLFNNGKAGVLVCTDVAARGLHIDNVSHIYNYELPSDPTDYVHRIGRTARAGENGKVINLLCPFDHDNFSRILREYGDFKVNLEPKPNVPRIFAIKDETPQNIKRGPHNRSSRGNNDPKRRFHGRNSSRGGPRNR